VGGTEEPAATAEDRPLVLDELDEQLAKFRLLRDDDPAATDAFLDDLGAHSTVDRDIIAQLSATRPLRFPERFGQAHALGLRAIEVLDRNGARAVPVPKAAGFLRPVIAYPIQQVCRFIVRSHEKRLIDSLADLYDRRLGWCSPDDPVRMVLLRASRDAHRAKDTYNRSPIGIPTFLLGGAAISGVGSGAQSLADVALGNVAAAVAAVALVTLLFTAVAAAIVRGAAVARRRIRLTVERPMEALWQTIGLAGNPPRDQARTFALYGVILTAVSWVVVPAGVLFVVSRL
jgi:hypothetical protein